LATLSVPKVGKFSANSEATPFSVSNECHPAVMNVVDSAHNSIFSAFIYANDRFSVKPVDISQIV
jgi:hypothetical protein